jgi:hypothetical protein
MLLDCSLREPKIMSPGILDRMDAMGECHHPCCSISGNRSVKLNGRELPPFAARHPVLS